MTFKSLKLNRSTNIFLLQIVIYNLMVWIVILLVKLNFFRSIFLFSWVPSIIIFLKLGVQKSTIIIAEAIIATFWLAFIIDYLAHINWAWIWSTVFNVRLLEFVPIEDLWWGFWFIILTISTYCLYNLNQKMKTWKLNTKVLITMCVIFSLNFIFIYLHSINREYLIIPQFYLRLIIAFFLAFILIRSTSEKKLKSFLIPNSFILIIYLIQEFIWLKLGHRYFPNWNHIWYLSSWMPIEELLFFIITPPLILLLHELHFHDI